MAQIKLALASGIKISFLEQDKPNGLPEAFIIGEKFIKKQNVALILGDNFFYGQGFTKRLKEMVKNKSGATIFAYPVNNPSDYGVAEIKNGKVKNIKEKLLVLPNKTIVYSGHGETTTIGEEKVENPYLT